MKSVSAIFLALALTAPAQAQLVARAERGSTPLQATALRGLETPVTVSRGDVVWRETLRPRMVVRLTEDAPVRTRPGPMAGPPAGTLLFGVRLASGYAYCPAIDYRAPVQRVQCFRDFDGDGTFNGRYVTQQRGINTQFVPAFLQQLIPVPRIAYEPADPGDSMDVEARVAFDGFRRGRAMFRYWAQDQRLSETHECRPLETEAGLCELFGLHLRIEQDGAAARVTLVRAPAVRFITITSTGGPDL